MSIKCLTKIRDEANTKLRPAILDAIISLYKDGKYIITAKDVHDEVDKINSSSFKGGSRLPAVCAAMRKIVKECRAIVISENRDFIGFTIKLQQENNS